MMTDIKIDRFIHHTKSIDLSIHPSITIMITIMITITITIIHDVA